MIGRVFFITTMFICLTLVSIKAVNLFVGRISIIGPYEKSSPTFIVPSDNTRGE